MMASKKPSLKVKKPKERWLLTRKTWRYMADAGRRLIPEGTTNAPEDIPVIESHFQEVCRRENRFLLWRKCSYPSALKHSRWSSKKQKGLKSRAGSTTELELSTDCSRLRGENKGRNSLPGVPRGFLASHRLIGKPGHGRSGVTADWTGDTEAVFETEEEEQEAENEAAAAGATADDGSYNPQVDLAGQPVRGNRKSVPHAAQDGGVKKKFTHFWKGSSDGRKRDESNYQSKVNLKSGKSSGSEESVNKIDWHHNLKSATSDEDFNETYDETELSKIRLRKVSSDENTNQSNSSGTHLRYGIGNLPKVKSGSRENLKLRHVENDRSNYNSNSSEQRIPLLRYSHDDRDYFDEEAESTWGAERSSYQQDKTQHQYYRHEFGSAASSGHSAGSGGTSQNTAGAITSGVINSSGSSGAHSTSYNISGSIEQRLPSRHNLTLPGLNIARPARSNHHISDINTSNYSNSNLQPTRSRRSGKVDHDFFSFQSHLSNWKPSDSTGNSAGKSPTKSGGFDVTLSATPVQQQSGAPKPTVTKYNTASKPVGPKFCEQGSQTLPISKSVMRIIENELQAAHAESIAASPQPPPTPPSGRAPLASQRRKSSIDSTRGPTASVTDDCSPSVGDTILRYLKMARKKNADGDKADRFKTVNYDRTLRYIKSKTPIEDENIKNIQTEESWLKLSTDPNLFLEQQEVTLPPQQDDSHLFSSDQESSDLGFASSSRAASSRSSFDAGELVITVPTNPASPQSPGSQSPSTGHSFLSQLLHGLQQAAGNPHMSLPTAMQKSKSSSSVGHHAPRLMAKKIWRTRSKSQSRATPSTTSTWTPQVSF
ncbi:hypothetical protein B566_EDAN004257 [Ephemera danica]|nr:hypothetical protein B566_EDAN004257 [Ephemera danica]